MSMFEKLNKSTKLFNVEVENPVFKKISDFQENDVVCVLGMYINKKSKFGDEPIFIVEDNHRNIFFVRMPNHHLETLNQIINDTELVNGVNNRECYIKIIQYFSKRFNKNCFDFEFVSKEDFTKQNQPTQQTLNNGQEDIF